MEPIKNVLAMVEYLTASGWKISKSKAYNDAKEKLFTVQKDGKILREDAEKYARRELQRLEGSSPSKRLEELQERKAEAEVAKIEAEAEYRRMKLDLEAGRLIPRFEVDKILAGAVTVLKTNMGQFIATKVREILFAAGGVPEKEHELREFLEAAKSEWFNQFSRDTVWRVRFGGLKGVAAESEIPGDDDAELDS